MDTESSRFAAALGRHDQALARLGLDIWVGAEPTFTDRRSEAPPWLGEALGGDKEARARQMLVSLQQSFPGSIVLRTLGRQYGGEDRPRWSLGLYGRRDAKPLWDGPPDPVLGASAAPADGGEAFWQALAASLVENGWNAAPFSVAEEAGRRIVFRLDGETPAADPAADPRLARPPLHSQAIPRAGLADELAAEGLYLLTLGSDAESAAPVLELPALAGVDAFQQLLAAVAGAARTAGVEGLILAGFPPPVDASVHWTTLTPDPAVVEANMAPAADAATFYAWSRALFAAARRQRLSPRRFYYNGEIADSGGGGQITLGGPAPAASPFFKSPQLLPHLIRYCNRHPSLSYHFAPLFIGSSSQSPRPDERDRESFEELSLALELLARQESTSPEVLWSSLASFLADPSGNTHRSEINIEKLWNPWLPGRGCLGVVEFRALRMMPSPEHLAALAALLRAVAARLMVGEPPGGLVDWGRRLHDRFALPLFLRRDLNAVLSDLDAAGVGLDPLLAEKLMDDEHRQIGETTFAGCRLTVRRALEFWPLLGDVASQEQGGSRLVDASTSRVQVTLRPESQTAADLEGWRLAVNGYDLPWRPEADERGPLRVFGVRYRAFVPWRGLHPTLPAHGPLKLLLLPPQGEDGLQVTLHNWRPDRGPYPGLPADAADARQRRQERFATDIVARSRHPAPPPPPAALTDWCLD
ncbi:MAG: transglutaminase family protein, partial [Pseudomonadota bacterium]|nr:transglutaminase family protein [Pseudomonadota bacterium]